MATITCILKQLLSPNPTRSILARALHSTTTTPLTKPTTEIGSDHLRDTFQTFKFAKNPHLAAGPVRSCDLKEDKDAVYARVDMPGIAEDGLKVWMENNSLYISGEEAENEMNNEEEGGRKYTTSLAIAPGCYNTDQVKVVLKNGVLRVVIPKIKGWEQSEVVNVNVGAESESESEF